MLLYLDLPTQALIAEVVAYRYRPSLEDMLEDYWRLMPQYQNINLEDLEVLRILFGFFATYRCGSNAPASCKKLLLWHNIEEITHLSSKTSTIGINVYRCRYPSLSL